MGENPHVQIVISILEDFSVDVQVNAFGKDVPAVLIAGAIAQAQGVIQQHQNRRPAKPGIVQARGGLPPVNGHGN